MELLSFVLPRIIVLVFLQLMWNFCLHKDYKGIDKKIEELSEENSRLFKECYKIKKNGKKCGKYCPLKDHCECKVNGGK